MRDRQHELRNGSSMLGTALVVLVASRSQRRITSRSWDEGSRQLDTWDSRYERAAPDFLLSSVDRCALWTPRRSALFLP